MCRTKAFGNFCLRCLETLIQVLIRPVSQMTARWWASLVKDLEHHLAPASGGAEQSLKWQPWSLGSALAYSTKEWPSVRTKELSRIRIFQVGTQSFSCSTRFFLVPVTRTATVT